MPLSMTRCQMSTMFICICLSVQNHARGQFLYPLYMHVGQILSHFLQKETCVYYTMLCICTYVHTDLHGRSGLLITLSSIGKIYCLLYKVVIPFLQIVCMFVGPNMQCHHTIILLSSGMDTVINWHMVHVQCIQNFKL